MILSRSQKADFKHWNQVIEKLDKKADKRGFSLESERQEKALAQSKIDNIYNNRCNGNCNPIVMSYDCKCPIHGWI